MWSRRLVPCSEWLIAALAFALRIQGLTFQSLWRDEVDSLRFASQPASQLMHGFVAPGHNGPLYYALLGPWLRLAGTSEFGARFFSVVCGAVAVPLIYRLGRRLFPGCPAVGWVGSILTCVSPYLVWYSQEARMYALVVCVVVGSLERLSAAVADGGWRPWLAYALLTCASFYLHFATALMIPVHAAYLLLHRRRSGHTGRARALVACGCIFLAAMPLLAWQLPRILHPGSTGYAFVALPQMLASLGTSFSSGVLGHLSPWALVPLLALIGLAPLAVQGDALRPAAALASWLLVPIFGLYLVTLVLPMYTARYLAFVLPAFLLLAGLGVQALLTRSAWLAGVLVAIILALSGVMLRSQASTPVKPDMRAAARLLLSRIGPDDRVIFQIPYARHSFEYYFRHLGARRRSAIDGRVGDVFFPLAIGPARRAQWIEGLYTNGGMGAAEVDARMDMLVGDSGVIWLVASEVTLWDERGLVQAWLERNARATERSDFTGVSVVRYDLQ